MTSKLLCPCCKSSNIRDFIQYENLPELLFPVTADIKDEICVYDLVLNCCEKCGHIFQSNVDIEKNNRIYQDLYSFYPFSNIEAFQTVYREPFEKMFEFIFPNAVQGMELLEIGCSSRRAMQLFFDKKFKCTSVDPSSESKVDNGLDIIGDFYENVAFNRSFDVIIMRFNLEHIIDLDLFISKICQDIRDDGLIFVQVPGVMNFMKQGTLCIGAHEHIHYFSADSLANLFKRFGFEVSIIHEKDTPSLMGCFRKKHELVINSIQSNYNEYLQVVDRARKQLKQILGSYKEICFYGCGLQLTWILYVFKLDYSEKKITIIDDNEEIFGRFMPYMDISITKPTLENLERADLIVLTLSQIYYTNVISKIRKLCSNKKILIFDSKEWKIIAI